MEIRKLSGSERFDAYLIFQYCFHGRIEDPETEREKVEKQTEEDWGAFDEDGTLMARIINNHYQFYLDHIPVKAGGIGAVSTLPEYRSKGLIRAIFQKLLQEAYQNGEVISALFPFNHAFYRKQGYDTVVYRNVYEFPPALLAPYRFEGEVRRYEQGTSVEEYLSVYQSFAKQFNLSAVRNEENMAEHMKVEHLYQERKFSYLLKQKGQPVAYVTFTDIKHDPEPVLEVYECAWLGREGFEAILGFLARFDADYGLIRLPLPSGMDLLKIIRTSRAYEIRKICEQNFMVRLIHAKLLLETIRKPAGCDVAIQIKDELLKENDGIWHVTESGAEKMPADTKADLTISERTLSQLAVGAISLEEAMLKPDVEVWSKEEMLQELFREKKIFVGEHF